MFFLPKEDNFWDSSIKQLGCFRKCLLPHILGNFSTIIDFIAKKLVWTRFLFLNWPSPKMPLIPRFQFGSTAQSKNAELVQMFHFSINSKYFYQTSIFDATVTLKT